MTISLPAVVSAEEWRKARDELLRKEKELTRASDAVNAQRRRLPMVAFPKEYVFSDDLCSGCSLVVDNIGHLAHLHARDTSLVVTCPAPLPQIESYKRRMGWTLPWVSARGNDFTEDCGVGDGFGVSVFLREGDDVYRTYFTTDRGGDQLVGTLRYLDLTPFGRQEAWEESGRGTDHPGDWWRLHDSYDS